MALFGKKEKAQNVEAVQNPEIAFRVLRAPRITEKAAIVTEKGAYVFNVIPGATKGDIKKAIQAVYKVIPVKVNVVNMKARKIQSRTRNIKGASSGGRKAYVYLKKGETIEVL
jgi:large subunit ribosomal protein L23